MIRFNKLSGMLVLFALSISIFSCVEDDQATGHSTISPTSPTATVNGVSSLTIVEQDSTIAYTITLSEPQVVNVSFDVSLADGATATEGSDFTFDHSLTIPAGYTSAVGEIKLLDDGDVEEDESFTLNFSTTGNTNFDAPSYTFTMTNVDEPYLSNTLDFTVDWGTDITLMDTTDMFDTNGDPLVLTGIANLCSHVDLDVFVFDGAGNDMGIYDAATGDCPEHLSIALGQLADGTYSLYLNNYINGVRPDNGTVYEFPTTISFERVGAFSGSAMSANNYDSSVGDYAIDGVTNFIEAIQFKIENGVFSVIDANTGDILGEG